MSSSAAWVLLAFRSNYADEFDCASTVVTTRDRWERAQAALLAAYPNGAYFDAYFDAYFGTNEYVGCTAASYIEHFAVHDITLATARELAGALGRLKIRHVYEGGELARWSWYLLVEHGVLPSVPDDPLRDWELLLAFPAPPARCYHGNVIGECGLRRSASAPPYVPHCRRDSVEVSYVRDADYEALMGAPLDATAADTSTPRG